MTRPNETSRATPDPLDVAYLARLGKEYQDLEYLINELVPASTVLANYIEHNLQASTGRLAPKEVAGLTVYLMNEEQSEGLFFLVYLLTSKLKYLHEKFHGGFDVPAEQGSAAA